MPRTLITLHLLLLAGCAESPPGHSAEGSIREMLELSAAAWNAGDLDGFMSSYAPDSNTTFVGHRELLRGYDVIEANYAPLFEPGATRDSLRFEDMSIHMIDPLHAVGYARWVLVRDGEPWRSGPFTLVVERRGTNWFIIHDHSSEEN